MKKVTLQNHWSLADRFLNERVFNRFFIQFSLVITTVPLKWTNRSLN